MPVWNEVPKGRLWTTLGERQRPIKSIARSDGYLLDIFETPVTVTPPTRNFKNLKFFKNPLKIRLLLGNERLLLGNERLLLGNERLLLGIIGVFGFFGISFFVAGGVLGLRGSGPPQGFSKISKTIFRCGAKFCTPPPPPTPENTLLRVGGVSKQGGGIELLPRGASKFSPPPPCLVAPCGWDFNRGRGRGWASRPLSRFRFALVLKGFETL